MSLRCARLVEAGSPLSLRNPQEMVLRVWEHVSKQLTNKNVTALRTL